MSKKTSKKNVIPLIPEIYRTLTREAGRQHQCIVEDKNAQFFRFNTPAENHIIADAIVKMWPNFNKFSEEPKQNLLTYHANLFKAEPPTDQDLVTTAVYTWFKMCDIATDRTAKTPTNPETGRKSTITNRKYFRGLEMREEPKTPQAIACTRIFRETIAAKETKELTGMPEDVKKTYVPFLTEGELKTAVEGRAGELRTRQDPWRIFQYYRPNLIALKIVRCD